MLLNLSKVIKDHVYIVPIKGAIVVGAHHFDEVHQYTSNGIKDFVLVEPAKEAYGVLTDKFGERANYRIFNTACGAKIEEREMFTETANKGQSNSLLRPDRHLLQYPDIPFEGKQKVSVVPLDFLPFDRLKYNFLSIDVQCFEMEVLKGAKEILRHIFYIMCEVNNVGASLYEGCTNIEEMDAFLEEFDFKRREGPTWIGGTWSDAFYAKRLHA